MASRSPFVIGEQVPVSIERHGDRGVAQNALHALGLPSERGDDWESPSMITPATAKAGSLWLIPASSR
jgi:hypothetical protein